MIASQDDDGDGMSNYSEFIAYTDPTNAASQFVIRLSQIVVVSTKSATVHANAFKTKLLLSQAGEISNMAFALQWQSARGRTYSVFSTDNLSSGWREEPDAEIVGTGEILEYNPTIYGHMMFFKVTVRLSSTCL